jgi:hypothetical protein
MSSNKFNDITNFTKKKKNKNHNQQIVIGDNKNDFSGSYNESYVMVMTICISLCEGCFFVMMPRGVPRAITTRK